jgi:hypothetical protein
MLNEAVNGLGPSPDVGDIMANRFGPNVPRERALTGVSGKMVVASVKAYTRMA